VKLAGAIAVDAVKASTVALLTAVEELVATTFPDSVVAAFAGTTEVSPNPREATATTATFFNEIVFTIFLSFSQIKVVLLSGW
jgi:hypothetical protein